MWLAFNKFILGLLLPLLGVFSVPLPGEIVRVPIGPAGTAEMPSRPQPAMRQGSTVAGGGAETKAAMDGISAALLKDCLARPSSASGSCLDELFREFLTTHSTAAALAVVQSYENTDAQLRLSCHPVVHAVGRETFRLTKTVQDSFVACDQTCHSGCYHGAMERFLRGDGADGEMVRHVSEGELREKAATACDPTEPTRFRFQCLHGLGHALVFFFEYRLVSALEGCDVLADQWSRSSCYGGAFMENVFSATPEKRDLSPTDYHYPCRALDVKYRLDCYMMQTTRMTEMGLTTERLFDECRKAGAHTSVCMQSIGRDLSNDARIKDPALTAEKCELGQGQERAACIRGVSYALIDNTWDGRYAFPFCTSFRAPEDVSSCFAMSVSYLRGTFEKREADISAECRAYARASPTCLEAAVH